MEQTGLSSDEVEQFVEEEVGIASGSRAAGRKPLLIVSGAASLAAVVCIALGSQSSSSKPGPSSQEFADGAFVALAAAGTCDEQSCHLSDWSSWSDKPTSTCAQVTSRFIVKDEDKCSAACKTSLAELKPTYTEVGQGDCDWHYKDGGKHGVQNCAELCLQEESCFKFTYGDALGCRYSSCGSDPGPDACPWDKQCPISPHNHGGRKYQLVRPYVKDVDGDCDWHYKSGGKIGVKKCADLCRGEPNCKHFSYGDALGCRYSSCGSDPGPDACPTDKQCPAASAHGGAMYLLTGCGAADCYLTTCRRGYEEGEAGSKDLNAAWHRVCDRFWAHYRLGAAIDGKAAAEIEKLVDRSAKVKGVAVFASCPEV